MNRKISALLINPWITDFAAYNLWAEPLGLLYVASILHVAGADVSYIDCLYSAAQENPVPRENGCSKYRRRIIDKPNCLNFFDREYARYGITDTEFLDRLPPGGTPDVVLVTSMMTYWYPGVLQVLELVRNRFGRDIPIILGGVYAMLCTAHAGQHAGDAHIYTTDDLQPLLPLIEGLTGKPFESHPIIPSFDCYPLPEHGLGKNRRFFAILTGKGCPFDCSYCASHVLHEGFIRRSCESVLKELRIFSEQLDTRNVAFYDDALLMHAEKHILPLLRNTVKEGLGLSIHLPNGIHARFVTEEIVGLFRASGVKTIRIGLETADPDLQVYTGGKTRNDEYLRAVELFRSAGYSREDVGTYVMLGLPGQTAKSVEESIDFVHTSGGAPHISYFSPIPGTGIWEEALKSSPFPVDEEPLFQNNTVFILGNRSFTEETIGNLKSMAIELRKSP